MENNTLALRADISCNNGCPSCCNETLEEIQAFAEAGLRNRALTLSAVVAVLVIIANILFQYYGKKLDIPDIVWVIVFAPWAGSAMGKASEIVFKKKFGNGGNDGRP